MQKRSAFLLPVTLLVLISAISAEQAPLPVSQPAESLKLIPEPKEVQMHEGSFRVRPTTKILVEFGHQSEDRIAAETLAEEIHDQSGLKIEIIGSKEKGKQQRSTIELARLQDRTVRTFLQSRGLKGDSIGDQGYLLFSDKSHLIVAANAGQGLFYGVQTLRQLLHTEGQGTLSCPAVLIRDWPTVERRGAKQDISRDLVSAKDFFPRRI